MFFGWSKYGLNLQICIYYQSSCRYANYSDALGYVQMQGIYTRQIRTNHDSHWVVIYYLDSIMTF